MSLDTPTATVAPTATATTLPPGLILFGRDENRRPHASRFAPEDTEAAERAATLMGMHTLAVADDQHGELAAPLPAGRIFAASGKAFVPFCKAEVFERLLAAAGLPDTPMPARAAAKPAEAAPPAAGGQGAPEGSGGAGGRNRPSDWDGIGRGSLVLACCGPMEGWFEAIIEFTKAHDSFTLRWRDWPLEPTIVRKRSELGLLPPDQTVGVK